ncbi:MAG: hypothetical protein WCP62_10315, partial [Planctomycetota bacterium]
ITAFAPVSLLFFFAALILLTATSGIRLHPVHYGFLAAAFFAFDLLLAYLADQLSAVDEAGESLLDRTMIIYGSGISDGDRHNHDDLPILMLGKAGGRLNKSGHWRYPNNTPLCNLYLWMLHQVGIKGDRFGDSSDLLRIG